MPKKKPSPAGERPQHDRFKDAARETGADESGKEFERAFTIIVPPARQKRTPRSDD